MAENQQKELFNDSIDFEVTKSYLLQQSEKRAWTIAGVSVLVTVLLVIALLVLMPLKTVEPYVIRVDSAGVPDIITALNEETWETNEAVDKYFVARYVRTREGYSNDTLQQDFDLVQLMSSELVKKEYDAEYDRPDSKDKKLTNRGKIIPEILSVVLGESAGTKTATVRFNAVTTTFNDNLKAEQKFVVTLSYDYKPTTHMLQSYRLDNPLGFIVTSYRVDPEF